jgi:site-specific DNA-methyltransferase (adenine-specific)
MRNYKLFNGDCLEIMKKIPDKSVDMILCDLPYGTTACKWDTVIPFEALWEQYNRIIKDNGAMVLFGSEPFSSKLRMSNLKIYKYDWKWVKSKVGNFLNCKNSPLKKYEDIMCFSKGTIANGSSNLMKYYPQGLIEINTKRNDSRKLEDSTIGQRPSRNGEYIQKYTNYPTNILLFDSEYGHHPTQKPVALLEYLIKTYTNENEIVLDNCMGSGSTGVACLNTNRKFIGIELDEKYFNVAKERIKECENNI